MRERLRSFSDSEHVTMYMTLLAGCQVLLHRYSGQHDIVIGSPIAGRNVPEVEQVIGFFVNPLVIRTDLGDAPSFRDAVRRVRKVVLEAFENQDVPFEQLVAALQPHRNLSRNPFFQVTFQLFAGAQSANTIYEAPQNAIDIDKRTSIFDLAFNLWETARGIEGRLEYSTDLFDADTIARLSEHFVVLLEAVAADPDCSIADLPIMSAAERHTVLVEWNDTGVTWNDDRCIHERVEAHAAAMPAHPAVRAGAATISYGELNARANRIARTLLANGVSDHRPVAVSLPPGLDRIAAMLAVLKAGLPYVPIDPALPVARVRFLIEDCQAAVVVDEGASAGQLPDGVTRVSLADPLSGSDTNPCVRVDASLLAYIIYTSGSTGTPKGVEVEHRGLRNLVDWHRHAYALTAADRCSHVALFSFDAAAWEVWSTLAAGATLVVADAETRADPDRLLVWLATEAITVSFLPTPLAEQVLRRPVPSLALRELLTGGDRLKVRPTAASPFRVTNHYGPTENTVVATSGVVEADNRMTLPSIGRPIANNQIYVLDGRRQPVPIGVVGEIYIGGDSLARGYHRQPELTDARFVPNPFASARGARMLRTGDLARWQPDGTIAFLGRNDRQMKIRGCRIEPAEIEAALAGHPLVDQAVVVTREDARGEPQLAAYIVPAADVAPSERFVGEVRAHSAAVLPDYMQPAVVAAIDAIPLTPHGKIDTAALPSHALALASGAADGADAAPSTETERTLTRIWHEVLAVEPIPTNANFFTEFGGHSLLAVTLVGRIREAFAIDLALRAIFEAPTVRQLAARIDAAAPAVRSDWSIPRRDPTDTAPCSFAQRRLWFLDRLTPGESFHNIPIALRLRTSIDPALLQQSLDVLVARHEVLRTTFDTIDGEPVQRIARDQRVIAATLDLQDAPPETVDAEIERLAALEARKPFVLAGGPLFRVTLLTAGPADCVLLASIHHIICDGWSVDVLLRDWTAAYRALERNEPAALRPLTSQFADYAAWQRDWLAGGALDAQLRYWTARLADLPALSLPTDRARPVLPSYAGSREFMRLDASCAAALKAVSGGEGVTLFMTMLAAFATLLARYSGETDVAVGTVAAGRPHPDLQHVMGLFVNTIVLRVDLAGNPTFRQLLRRVRETALGAYAHADVPFERLVEALQPERDLSRHPLVQVTLQVFSGTHPSSDGTPRQLDTDRGVATFDLALDMWEENGGVIGRLEYSTDLFDRPTIVRTLRHFETLVNAAAADPDRPIESLPVMGAAEFAELHASNRTEHDRDWNGGVHELIAQQCARTPAAAALVGGGRVVTYAELRACVLRFIGALASHGVRPGDIVAVALDRCCDWVASVLAVLEAGAAFVPLDADWPPARMLSLMHEAGAQYVIAARGSGLSHADIAVIDPEEALIGRPIAADPIESRTPAYVLHTSGSTGRPKGVVIEHGSLANHARAAIERFGLTPADRVLQFAPLSFDVSLEEIVPTLVAGGTVVFRPGPVVPSCRELVSFMTSHGVTVANLPAAFWHHWVDEIDHAPVPSTLRMVIVGSETVDAARVSSWLERVGSGTRLVHAYGTTETTITALTFEATDGAWDPKRPFPIGRPLANVTAHILGTGLQPVPPGIVGDLYIGGAAVARGYLNDESRSFSLLPGGGGRVYRTGDRAKRLQDGNIVFIGRVDEQIKVRGFRVEPAEIVTLLKQHPAIQDAVIVARDDRLTAYVVAAAVSEREVLSFMRERAPHHLVPAAIVLVEALPVGAHGKIDVRRLPAPSESSRPPRREPRTDAERVIGAIWEEMLAVPVAPIDTNFFELGGHSLLLLRVHSRLERAFSRTIAVVDLFRHPTISSLAHFLSGTDSADVAGAVGGPYASRDAVGDRFAS